MSKRDIKLFIHDIDESIDAINDYVKNIEVEEFMADRKTYSAVIREFEIIGEATKRLPENLLQQYDQIEWRNLKDFRNMLIHEYFGVDFEIVWTTIHEDLPPLKKIIIEMIDNQ